MNFSRFLYIPSVYAYSICKQCIHHDTPSRNETQNIYIPRCNLLKSHPLFKERPDVHYLGKEICTEKGKYFNEKKTDIDEMQVRKLYKYLFDL